ncbi:hypothetical protein [Streptomyces sp. NPDC001450]
MPHRFVRRLPSAGIALTTLALLCVGAVGAAAAPVPPPKPMSSANPANFTLSWGNEHRADAESLRRTINPGGASVRLGTVLDSADSRQADKRCDDATDQGGALTNVANLTDWYCLTRQNSVTDQWTPQGVSGTEDAAYPGDRVDGRRAFVFSWHEGPVGGSGDGSRLSFLDPDTAQYVHVLLVEPRKRSDGSVTFGNLRTHAGGIAWYGNYIFVADVHGGLHVFDMRNMLDLEHSEVGQADPDPDIGLHFSARNYAFALPEIGTWQNRGDATYDYMSLDHSVSGPPEALTGEWCNPTAANATCQVGRVARWKIGDLTSFSGTAQATTAYHQPTPYTQGAASWQGCYYFNDGGRGNSYLITARPGSTPAWRQGGRGLQDLYVLPSRNELWTITEFTGVGRRVLYGVHQPSCP